MEVAPRDSRGALTHFCLRPRVLLVGVAALLGAPGCGGGDGPPRQVAVEAVCGLDDGARVEVQGYLRLPEKISLTDRAVIDLFTRRGGAGDRASVNLVLGTGPNQLERPEAGFTPTSLRVRGGDGTVATLNDRVVVVAKVTRADGSCVLGDATLRVVTI